MVSVILRCTSQAEIQYFLDITLDLFGNFHQANILLE